jgi:hypothetical protein
MQLSSYPPCYIRSNPTPERLTETVERLEEDTTDKARIHGRWHVILEIGHPVTVNTNYREGQDCLSKRLQHTIQSMLDAINHRLEASA